MTKRMATWRDLLAKDFPPRGQGKFPITAYSEFMPAPRIGMKPYGTWTLPHLSESAPGRWLVTAREEAHFLRPGLANIGTQLINDLVAVAAGKTANHIGSIHLADNRYWPKALAGAAATLTHERFLILSPLALSRTQDDKGRVRWTLFGGSDEGPSRGFWQSFYAAPGVELPEDLGRTMLFDLLAQVYGEKNTDLKAAGLRVLPEDADPQFRSWTGTPPPSWMVDLMFSEREEHSNVKYLLTFQPFSALPTTMQTAYLAGRLHLLPYPGSLVFWGSPHYRKLAETLPGAIQIPLLQSIARHDSYHGIRVPQSGWMFEKVTGGKQHSAALGPLRNGFRRSHRWEWIERNDEADSAAVEHGMQKVLFSAHPDDVGLYGKPMGRNAQVWTDSFEALLHGPTANSIALKSVITRISSGGSFGYRMYYPPMTLGLAEVFWHRPLVAFRDFKTGQTRTITDGFAGFLSACEPGTKTGQPVQFRPAFATPVTNDPPPPAKKPAVAAARAHAELNLRKLALGQQVLGPRLPESFARSLLTADKDFRFADWQSQAVKANAAAPQLAALLSMQAKVPAAEKLKPSQALTFSHTATRDFEVNYWNTIAALSMGEYTTKNNGDVVVDPVTLKHRKTSSRDLDPLGDYLISYYQKLIADAGMTGRALAGEHRFQWRTDFDYEWMGGWTLNQKSDAERNIICVIPGNNRKEAVVLGDHYDTAYMEDVFGYGDYKGDGARLAAAGADDNNSATATLMLAAPIFLEMSKRGELGCDIWMVHLTGEEFPSDCLGARSLSQALIEGTLKLGVAGKKSVDLSGTHVRGVYVMDMIAHNNERNRDIFQMAPGTDPQSLWLAFQAQRASELWRLGAGKWNEKPERKAAKRGKRSKDPAKVPALARHLAPLGEVRPHFDPKSTLFNTDGQVFSDAGVPVVLFMENYDINRQGYHDQHDTMENIDLDYGAAVAAICIEAAARAANETPPDFEAIRKAAMGG